MKSYSPNEYSPKINEGVASIFNVLDTEKTNRALMVITNSLAMIYKDTGNSAIWQNAFGVIPTTVQRIQRWYLNEKFKFGYGELDANEAGRLIEHHPREIAKLQQSMGVKISEKQRKLIDEFRQDIHYGLKNFIEIIARSVIEDKIRKIGLYDHVEVYLASDIDDILGGVDIIVKCIDKNNDIHTIGIDVAVSENMQYLEAKKQNSRATLIEYPYRKNTNKHIERIVFALSPKLMQESIIKIMHGFENGESINPGFIANTYGTKNSHTLQSEISELVKNITLH